MSAIGVDGAVVFGDALAPKIGNPANSPGITGVPGCGGGGGSGLPILLNQSTASI